MSLETYGAPSSAPKPGAESTTGYTAQPNPTAPPTETFKYSGIVRVVETLGFDSDIINCPYCTRREQTVVDKQTSQTTT
jgi:hypothetical protein